MSKAGRIASIAVAMVLGAITAFGQSSHTLQGRVSLPNGSQPPNPVKVAITFGGMHVYETFTDLSGRFSFSGLRRGVYVLVAEGDGETFETTSVRAEISAYGSAPQSFTQNIQLQTKVRKAPPPAALTAAEIADPNLPTLARQEYEKGIKEARNNNPEKAAMHFRGAIAAHSPFYSARVAFAEQCTNLKREADAAQAYREAIEIRPDRAPAYVGLGMLLVKQKKYAEAIQPLRRSLEIEKQSSAPYLFLGLAEMMTGDYQSSETNLLKAYAIGKPPLAHLYLANLYELKGDPDKGIEELKAFLKENPNLPSERETEIRDAITKLRKQAGRKKP